MLSIPKTGFAVSVSTHNGRLDVHADWVEASALFTSESISRADVVDSLIENNTYRDQSFANEWVSNVFTELGRRFDLLGGGGALSRERNRIRRTVDWRKRPAYAFCLALGVQPHYRECVEAKCGTNYGEQGELFERLCAESIRAMQWDIEPLGWSKIAANSVTAKVDALASAIGEPALRGAVQRWTQPHAKDAGLDLVAWRGFQDGWGGRPICLVQCASGEDWSEKLHTPNLATWEKLIDFSTKPRRGLAMPFAPGEDEFRRRSNSDFVMLLLDRHRILSPTRNDPDAFPTRKLARDLVKWTRQRVAIFPRDDQ